MSTEQSNYQKREAALDRINDDPAWAQRVYGAPEQSFEQSIVIRAGELRIKTYSGVKIQHIPSGLIAFCGTEKSQLRNKEIALIMLRAGLEQYR